MTRSGRSTLLGIALPGFALLSIALLLATCGLASAQSPGASTPAANPSRPTVTNPATLPPVGYLQFEQGYLGSLGSPATSAQYGVNQVTKIALQSRLLVQVQFQPYAASQPAGDVAYSNGFGDILAGAQAVLFSPVSPVDSRAADPTTQSPRKTPVPTVSLGYLGRVRAGTTGDTDQGSYSNSLLLLLSGDVGGFHYDTNYIVNDQAGDSRTSVAGVGSAAHSIRRAQFAQTLSVNHSVGNPNLQLSVEVYHFSQPLVYVTDDQRATSRANLLDLLLATSYQLRPNLVLDGGFSHGFTSTSTRWQSFAGFTYLLPHRLWPQRPAAKSRR